MIRDPPSHLYINRSFFEATNKSNALNCEFGWTNLHAAYCLGKNVKDRAKDLHSKRMTSIAIKETATRTGNFCIIPSFTNLKNLAILLSVISYRILSCFILYLILTLLSLSHCLHNRIVTRFAAHIKLHNTNNNLLCYIHLMCRSDKPISKYSMSM